MFVEKNLQLIRQQRDSMVAKTNPLTIIITTAGIQRNTGPYERRQNLVYELKHNKTTEGGVRPRNRFTLIYCLNE